MKVVCISYSQRGYQLGERIKLIEGLNIIHLSNKVELNIKNRIKELWDEYDCIIFISASGIAVRTIAPYIRDKFSDPAVVVIDDNGENVISLLSGHIGGANDLTKKLAAHIGARPIITTASDLRGFKALDLFAKENKYTIKDKKYLTKIMADMVDGKKIGFYTEDSAFLDYSQLVNFKSLDEIDEKKVEALVIVSSNKIEASKYKLPFLQLIPKNINIGIGCKKGMGRESIIRAINEEFDRLNVEVDGIKEFGTVEVKKNELGLREAAAYYKVNLKIFTIEEISIIEDMFSKSEFVKETIGVYNVSEPCGYMLGGRFLSRKTRHNGITLSILKEENNG